MYLRDIIINVLRSNERPLGAYDIARQVSQIKGRKCHANSIYRVLGAMIRAGKVHYIATMHSFALIDEGPAKPLWCICQGCNTCRPLDADRLHQSLDKAARSCGFRPVRQHVEMIGICADCSEDSAGLTIE